MKTEMKVLPYLKRNEQSPDGLIIKFKQMRTIKNRNNDGRPKLPLTEKPMPEVIPMPKVSI